MSRTLPSRNIMLLRGVYASLVLILLITPVIGDGYFRCKEQERQALLEIKQEFVDVYDILSSWSNETDCCRNWRGVRCSKRTGHVVMLDLHAHEFISNASGSYPSMQLAGNVSLSLLKLRHLNYLDLSYNDFDGSPILDFKGALGNLRYVNFSRAGFAGLLSYQFANLSRLQSLDLCGNYGLRYAPESIRWLSSLSSIHVLNLSLVDLGGVKDLFQVVNTLPSLRELRLQECSLSVDLPGNLNSSSLSLEVFDLSHNYLDGFIPDSMGNMTSLVNLDLSSNNIDGGVPKSFGRRLCRLQSLDLPFNNLEGDLEILVGNISGCMEKSLASLNLQYNRLHGSLPDISIFTNLREVLLSRNQLNGSLPEKFMHPSKLEVLDVTLNQLTGSIPDVAMLAALTRLQVGHNQLNGTVSQSIGSLSELEVLDASGNSLTGTLSEPLFLNLSKLKALGLSGNSLFLQLSENFTPSFQLEFIVLQSCKHQSNLFPKWVQTQKNCFHLDISDAGIFGTIPSWIWDFSPPLRILNLSSNNLHGKLPDLSMKISGQFSILDLSSNNLESELPLFPPNTSLLNLYGNKFSGNISALCRITAAWLSFLDLSDNLFTGSIPYCFGQFENLGVLNLADNRLTGEIPFTIGQYMLGITALDLHNNSFHGNLPSSLRNCQRLRFLDVSENNLSGTLPTWIGQKLTNLVFLGMKSNYFSGVIPQDLCKLKEIQILDLAINNITGVIPRCLCNLTAMVKAEDSSSTLNASYNIEIVGRANAIAVFPSYFNTALIILKGREELYGKNLGLLRIIDLSSNRLTGRIPSEITSLVALTGLNLSRNSFFGKIPGKIGDLKKIESLDLSNNHLSGEIPNSLSELTFLSYLDLSNNNLFGRIPTSTQIEGFNSSVFSGNHGLCGKPLGTECSRENTIEEQENPRKEDSNEMDDDEFWTRFYVGIGLGFVIGIWGICIVPLLKRKWRVSYLGFLDFLILKFHIMLARFKSSRS